LYSTINNNIGLILGTISQQHVDEYDWLITEVKANNFNSRKFKSTYRKFWMMNTAGLCANFQNSYFNLLSAQITNPVSLSNVVLHLYNKKKKKNGSQKIQFSFATKLFHMANNNSPIYDSLLSYFYHYKHLSSKQNISQRVSDYLSFHGFLVDEYSRILAQGLLLNSINSFRMKFNPQHFTDEKIIDSILWASSSLLKDGFVTQNKIKYH